MLAKDSTFKINSKKELDEIFQYLKGIKISDDDLKDEHEILSILVLIASISKSTLLDLPLKIHRSESPDFRLEIIDEGRTIGIEHVRATLPEYKIADREFLNRPEGSLMEPSLYSPFKRLPKKEAYAGIRSPGEKLKGDGWEGDSIEVEWAYIAMAAIISKTDLLNKKHFKIFNENHLLIEDDSPVELFRNLSVAIKQLKNDHQSVDLGQNRIHFNKVHILSNHDFIYDVFGKCIKTDVSKKAIEKLF